jgi:hypothetical protein
MRYVTLNVTEPTTTDKDVKRTDIVRLLNPSIFYFVLCLIYFYVILCLIYFYIVLCLFYLYFLLF